METVNFAEVVEEFKTVAEVRALIVLNGMKITPTPEALDKAIVYCACVSPYIGPADSADWRLFTVEIGEDFTNVHLPSWLVDTALQFVTDDELDTVIETTPIEAWITGLRDLARNVPPAYHRAATIELCDAIEDAGKVMPEEHRAKVQKAVADKVARVRKQKEAQRNGEPVPDQGRDIRVAIIGL